MSVQLSHVWQGNVFFLKTHASCSVTSFMYICMSNKVQHLDIQENNTEVIEKKLHYDFKRTLQFNRKIIGTLKRCENKAGLWQSSKFSMRSFICSSP